MSSFTCPECDTRIIETERGYVTECEHFPLEEMNVPSEIDGKPIRKQIADRLQFGYVFVRDDESGELIPEPPRLVKWFKRRKREQRSDCD